jgi:hypothetical protein
MIITIEDKKFKKDDIKKLYPAAIVKTGFKDETTQISLEWLDTECNGAVEVVKFGIFITLKDESKYSFFYEDRKKFDIAIEKLANQF